MARRAWLLGLVLAVPLVGFCVARGIKAHFDSQVRSAVREQFPDANADRLSQLTLDTLCESPTAEMRDLCDTNANLNLMSDGSLAAGGAGLTMLVLIALAGLAARNSRILLVLLFKPGLYLTAVFLTGLILVHAAIAMAAIYYGESELVGRVHIGIIAAIGLGALGGVIAIARSTFSLVKKAQTIAIGKSVSLQEAPQLWQKVMNTAERLGALRPEHVVVGLDPNFFVTEADVLSLSGTLTGRTLYCSLPLARLLTTDELTAVIGHELGHFKGSDTKFSERFYPIYRGTATSIASLHAAGGEGSGSVALLPAIAVLTHFLESFAVAEHKLGRDRELAADQAGAFVTDSRTMATALVKVHAFSGLWSNLQQAAVEALKEGKLFVNASKTYADAAAHNATPAAFDGIAETHLSHPTDSHPPLSVRLKSLGVDLLTVSEAALIVTPKDAAIALVSRFEQQEQEISEAYQVLLANRLGIDVNAAQQVAKEVPPRASPT